jgi:putative transposase
MPWAADYEAAMDDQAKRAIALWRIGVLGPLVSARLSHGDRQEYFDSAAARTHLHPDGRVVRVAAATIEAWYYAYRRSGFDALLPKSREDRHTSRAVPRELCELLVRAKRERPRRSIRRLIRMLERAGKVPKDALSRSTVHRVLRAAGVSARPPRNADAAGGTVERRSFLVEHAGDLWIGDAMHGPRVQTLHGLRKAYCLSQIDGATRYIVHSYFALSEDAPSQEHGFKQAILKHGLPRTYYVDRGAAYVAHSLRLICAELRVRLLHTKARDCEAKGVIERWHERWRAEVEDELPETPITLEELNAIHWAWLARDYHDVVHETTARAPRAHFLSEIDELRAVPREKNLDEVFLHRARRTVRKDATVRWQGGYLEVRPELVGREIELRFDPMDPTVAPRVFDNDRFVCDTRPLDLRANASRPRRRLGFAATVESEPTGLDPLGDLLAEHYDRVRLTGAARDDDNKDQGDPASPDDKE